MNKNKEQNLAVSTSYLFSYITPYFSLYGVVSVDEDILEYAVNNELSVMFGEVAGEGSEIIYKFNFSDFEKVETTKEFGFNPFLETVVSEKFIDSKELTIADLFHQSMAGPIIGELWDEEPSEYDDFMESILLAMEYDPNSENC